MPASKIGSGWARHCLTVAGSIRTETQLVSLLGRQISLMVRDISIVSVHPCKVIFLTIDTFFNQFFNFHLTGRAEANKFQNYVRLGKHGKWDDTFKDKEHPFVCTHTGNLNILKHNRV